MVQGLEMMSKRLRPAAFLLVGLLLSACSSGDQLAPYRSVMGALGTILDPSGKKVAFPEPTRAQLDEDGRPILRATILDRDANALLVFVARNGAVETWASVDGGSFSLRDGVVTQTRGLGPDLMSASIPSASALARGAGEVRRVHYYLGPNDQTISLAFTCTLASQGAETVTISGLSYRTTRVSETCTGSGQSFRNLYWFQSGSKIRQSVQWIGPNVGKVALFDLRR